MGMNGQCPLLQMCTLALTEDVACTTQFRVMCNCFRILATKKIIIYFSAGKFGGGGGG